MSSVRPQNRGALAAFHDFWFEPKPADILGLFRICFGLFIGFILLISLPNWERFYGPDATWPLQALRDSGGHVWTIFSLSESSIFLWGIYFLLIACAFTLTVGYMTGLSTFILFIGYTSMITRNTWMVNGQDQVVALLLFISCFAPLGSAFSIDCKRNNLPQNGNYEEVWALRLMQISVALIYLFSGPTKIPSWIDGNAIYYVSHSQEWFRFPDLKMMHDIWFSRIATWGTLVLETVFPFLIWFSKIKRDLAILMIFFHFLIMLFLSPAVFYFNLIMIVSLLLFLE